LKQALIIYFFLASCLNSFGQGGKLTGSVADSVTRSPLELATVSVFRQDSSLVTYKLSDRNGNFAFDKLPLATKLFVSISYTGFTTYNRSIQLEAGKTETLSVLLSVNEKDSNGVVVTATIPIRMNGDTLEINPAAFKMKQGAVIEELLNQVSGIVIWSDGSITVNGMKVQSLLVDGKPFLGAKDNRVATQNLPKSAVDKIQLYQEYDRTRIGQEQSPQDSLLTMNIKLKDNSKKGYFGKAGAGYGTRDRFESDISFQTYTSQSSLGIGGGFNNINKNIGNIQEMFQNNTFRNYNPNLYNVGRFGTNGITRNHSIGGVFSHSFIEAANSRQNNRIMLNYNKSGTDAYVTELILQNRTALANPQFQRDVGVQNNENDKHDIGINYVKTNSYNDNFNLNGAIGTANERNNSTRYTEVRDSVNQLQNTNDVVTLHKRKSDNESLTLNFTKSNVENPAKNFSLLLDARRSDAVAERNVRSVFHSFTDMSKNASYDRQYITNNNSVNLTGTLDYLGFRRMLLRRFNLFGINLSFIQRFNYSRTIDNSQVSDYDTVAKQYNKNSNLSNQNKRDILEYTPSVSLSKSFSKYSSAFYRYLSVQVRLMEEFKSEKNISSIPKRSMDRDFQFFRYEGYINYSFTKTAKYRYFSTINFAKTYEYPTVDLLYTIVDDINVYEIRIGNPNLLNKINHTASLYGNFETENPKSLYSVNANINGRYNRSINPVTDSIINDLSGKRTSYYINTDKSNGLNFNYNINISRKFKRSNLQLMYIGQFSANKLPNYIDSRYNISKTGNLSNQITIQFSLRSLLVMNLGQTFQYYKTEQTAAGLNSFKNTNRGTKLGVVLNYPENFSVSSTIESIDNSNLNKPTILWNAFTTYRFMKQQAEVKFSAMDLLKQYQNITNSVNTFGTSTRITNGLQQYFLLTFSYYPRKFGKTEVKKQQVSNQF
jgi:hypothetical protein